MKPGSDVILASVPDSLLHGLPDEDQAAILAMVDQPVRLEEYDDGKAVLAFTDSEGDGHTIWVDLHHIRPIIDDACPLCSRPLAPGTYNDHHLVPKSKKGKETVRLHKFCHANIHAIFTDRELANTYNTIAALLTHPDVQKFVAWVATKPPDFSVKTKRKK
jgi:hypothetical protein